MKAEIVTCQKCGGETEVVVPFRHVPICRLCHKPIYNAKSIKKGPVKGPQKQECSHA